MWDERILYKRLARERRKNGLPAKPGRQLTTVIVPEHHFELIEQVLAARSLTELKQLVIAYLKQQDPRTLICGSPFEDWTRQATVFRHLGKKVESCVLETAVMVQQELSADDKRR